MASCKEKGDRKAMLRILCMLLSACGEDGMGNPRMKTAYVCRS